MEDDGGLLILLFSFLLLFHFSFSFLSPHLLWFFSFYYFVVLSSPLFSSLPLLLPLLLSCSTLSIYFSKKVEKSPQEIEEIKEIKAGVEEKKKTQDEKGFRSLGLWMGVTPPQFQSLPHFSWSALPLHLPSHTSVSSLYL